jgi:hypothetical protein
MIKASEAREKMEGVQRAQKVKRLADIEKMIEKEVNLGKCIVAVQNMTEDEIEFFSSYGYTVKKSSKNEGRFYIGW